MIARNIKKIINKDIAQNGAVLTNSTRDVINKSNITNYNSINRIDGVPYIMCGFRMVNSVVCSGERPDSDTFTDPFTEETF